MIPQYLRSMLNMHCLLYKYVRSMELNALIKAQTSQKCPQTTLKRNNDVGIYIVHVQKTNVHAQQSFQAFSGNP